MDQGRAESLKAMKAFVEDVTLRLEVECKHTPMMTVADHVEVMKAVDAMKELKNYFEMKLEE